MKKYSPKKTFRERIEEHIEIKYLLLLIVMGVGGAFIAVYLTIVPLVCNPSEYGGDKLPQNCKTTDCANDLLSALRSFSKEMDMNYAIGPNDHEIIFIKNGIDKEYYRDGIQYRAYFHLIQTDGSFSLRFYKRGKLEPGHLATTYGNYGTIVLPKCKCK